MRPQTACMNRCKVALATFMQFFPSVSFPMVPQVARSYMCKVTLFAFVRFFSRLGFQMEKCKVTLFAFFSRMSFQMRPQTACMNQCKVVLAMNVQINANFSKCDFPERIFKCLQIDILNKLQITLVACVRLFSGVSFQVSP